MIKLSSKDLNVVQVSKKSPKQNVVQEKIVKDNQTHETREFTTNRPDIVDAKVYKVKSSFVKNSVFVTLGYISENSRKRPFEIFINQLLDNLDIEFNLGTKSKKILNLINNQYRFINEEKDVDIVSFCFECEYFNTR